MIILSGWKKTTSADNQTNIKTMLPDINEQLTIKSLYKYLENENLKIGPIKSFQKESGLQEGFFINTLLSIERKGLVEIGFKQRERIIKIKNWNRKYVESDDFFIRLTKDGIKYCVN